MKGTPMTDIRKRIDLGFESFGSLVFRNRWKALLLTVLVLGAFVSQLPKLKFDTTNESYFREDDPTISEYNAFREQFGREEMLIMAINPPEVFDSGFLKKLAAFHAAIEDEVPYVKEVTSLINVRDTRGEGELLVVEDLMKTIPETPDALAALKKRVLSSKLYPNFLVSEDGRFTTVVVETLAFSPGEGEQDVLAGFTETDGESGVEEARLPLTVEENRALVLGARAVVSRFEDENFPVRMAGGPPTNEFFERTMQADMGQFMGLAFLTIGVFLFFLFRRISGFVLPLLVVIISLLSTIGLMAGTGVPFTIPTTILPSFLLAVGVGASVHLLALFFREFKQTGDKEGAIVFSLGHSGLPIVMTSATTAAGLYAFIPAEMAPVSHLGIFGGTGVLIALMYTLVLVPTLLALWPMSQYARFGTGKRAGGFDRFLIATADFATSRSAAIVGVAAAVVAISVVGLFSLRFVMDFKGWMPETLPIRQAMDQVDAKMKGSATLELVVDTGEENGLYDPAVLQGVEALAEFAKNYRTQAGLQLVGKTNSVVEVLKETNRALNENREEFYRLPDSRELVAQELLLFENSGSDDLERLVDSQFSKARLTLGVPMHEASVYVKFVADLQPAAQRALGGEVEVTITGTMRLFTKMIFTMMRSMVTSYTIAFVVISLLMILLIGSLRIGLLSMIPNLSPIFITMGVVMGFTGIPLDVFTLLTGSIALGLAVDDTIHFFHNFRRYYGEGCSAEEAVRQTFLTSGRAMLFTTLVLVTGFWLFMLATLNNVFNFGLLTGVALLLALAADFLLAPALMILILRTEYGRNLTARWCGSTAPAGT